MANKAVEGFLLTINFYKSAKYADILDPEKWKPEGRASIQSEGAAVKKQENMTTKQIVMQKIHTNDLHTNIGHP